MSSFEVYHIHSYSQQSWQEVMLTTCHMAGKGMSWKLACTFQQRATWQHRVRSSPATAMREASPSWSSCMEICTSWRVPAVACSSVFKSYEVYGPSVSLLGRRIVQGSPDCCRSSSACFLYCSTPAWAWDHLKVIAQPCARRGT